MERFDERYDVVVIGGGIAGLTCGAFLAKAGRKVKVFEKHLIPGGYCTTFERKGFKLDGAGLILIGGVTEGGPIYDALELLGVREDVDFFRCDKIRYALPGETIEIPVSVPDVVKMLSDRFPDQKEGIKALFDVCGELYKQMTEVPPESPMIMKYKDKTASELIDDYIKDPRLKDFIGAIGYTGLPSKRYSAVLKARALMTRFGPVYSPAGGMQAIADAYANGLRKFGGELALRTKIEKILLEKGKAVGVQTMDGRRIKADHVVSNAAAFQTFGKLIEEDSIDPKFMEGLRRKELCLGGFMVYLGVDLDLKAMDIAPLTYLNDRDLEGGYEACEKGEMKDAWIFMYVPSLFNPTLCPNLYGENENIIILFTYAPYDMDWRKEKDRVADVLINRVAELIPNLKEHIIVRDAASPLTMERYTLNTRGAVVGWAYSSDAIPANKLDQKTPIKNLYLAGHWTRPGAGISETTRSGRNTAEMIIESR